MFIYNFNEKGLNKFEKDINDRIQECDVLTITLENKDTMFSVDLTKEEIRELDIKVNIRYSENESWNYIDFDFKKIFLGSLCINDDILKITYDYDNYDSIEHYHKIYLRHSNLIFEYYNELDETIVKEHMEE